jgi:hypothetical protein
VSCQYDEINKEEKIDCDFRRFDGYLFQARDTDGKMIDDELEAVRNVGAPVHRIAGVPLRMWRQACIVSGASHVRTIARAL